MSRSPGAANPGWPPRHPAGEADPRAQGRQAPQPQPPQQGGGRGQAPAYGQPQQGAGGYPQQPQEGYADPQQGYGAPQPAPTYGGGQQGYHYPQDQHPAQPPQQQYAPPQPSRQPPQYAPPTQPPVARGQQPAPAGMPAAPRQQQNYAPPQQPQHQPAINRQGLSSLDSARAAQPTHDFNNFPRTQPPQQQYAPPREPSRPSQAVAPGGQGHAAALNGRANVGHYPQQPQVPQPQHQQPVSRQPQPPAYTVPGAENGARAPENFGGRQVAGQFGAGREPASPSYEHAPSYDQWPPAEQHQPLDAFGQEQHAPRGFPAQADYGAAGDYGFANGRADPYADPQQNDWGMSAAAGYGGEPGLDAQGYDQQQAGYGQYDPQHGGELEPVAYNPEEFNGYEAEAPRRASWAMRIAGALVVAIGLGYGIAQAYQAVIGSPVDNGGAPPVIASDDTPAKERPADPGGRQFSHTDSKVLGRLEQIEGGSDAGLHDSDQGNGTRKVSTLVVGRDGSIMPPSADEVSDAPVSVPGMMVVDAFGTGNAPTAPMMPRQPEADNPPPRPTVNVKSTRVIPATTASIEEEEPAPARRQTVAAAPPASSAPARSPGASGANGYVVVLSSVPASGSSRLDALRKFADMQQQYGPVLANKTPDVRETVLAGKGAYHRLLVGPPGSKTQANELCIQLKASGYSDCWVTAY